MEALKLSKWVFVRKLLKGFIRFRMKNKYAKKKGMSTQESNLMLELTLPSFPFCLLPPCFYSNEWKVKPTQQLNEVVIHFQISARTKLQIEFLYTYRPEEPEKKKWTFWIKNRLQFTKPFHCNRHTGRYRDVWLVAHVFQRFGWLWMVFGAILFLVVKAQTILSAQVWKELDFELTSSISL